jgi:hypothetical protein
MSVSISDLTGLLTNDNSIRKLADSSHVGRVGTLFPKFRGLYIRRNGQSVGVEPNLRTWLGFDCNRR